MIYIKSVDIYVSDFLSEEIINFNDKLKMYSKYNDKKETKNSLFDRIKEITDDIKNDTNLVLDDGNSLISNINCHKSNKPGLSNYINIKFNVPDAIYSNSLAFLTIRISDHRPQNYNARTPTIFIDGRTLNKVKTKIYDLIEERKNKINYKINRSLLNV